MKEKKHYIMQGVRRNGNVENTIAFCGCPCEYHEAVTWLADAVIRELGDGDGENGGKGSLKNCYGDIWNALYDTGRYDYADCRFTITENI